MWAPYGGAPSDEIFVKFGMTKVRFLKLLTYAVASPECDFQIAQRIRETTYSRAPTSDSPPTQAGGSRGNQYRRTPPVMTAMLSGHNPAPPSPNHPTTNPGSRRIVTGAPRLKLPPLSDRRSQSASPT